MLEVLHSFDMIDLFTSINCHDTNRKVLEIETAYEWLKSTRLDVGLDPLQRNNLIIQTIHTSRTYRCFWVFQKKGNRFFDQSKKSALKRKFWDGQKKPIWGLKSQKKNNFKQISRANRPYVTSSSVGRTERSEW